MLKLEQVPRGSQILQAGGHFLIIKYFKVNDNDKRQKVDGLKLSPFQKPKKT